MKKTILNLFDIRITIIVLLLTILFCHNSMALQSDSLETKESISVTITNDAKHFLNTGIGLATLPLSFSKADWMNVGMVAISTASLFAIDKNIRDFALKNQTNLNDGVFNFDTYYGNAYTALFAAGIYGFGLISGNDKIRRLGLNTYEAFLYSGLITGILKVSIGRRRPYAGNSHLYFNPFQFTNNDFQSLPSGHTTVGFAVSTVMANYIDNIFWKVFWYGAAGMVSFSRIYHNQHWFSDVFLGAAVGYFVGSCVVNQNTDTNSNTGDSLIRPYISVNRIGIVFLLK